MNAELINPFLKAVIEVLSTMARIEAKPGKPFVKKDKVARGDVTGMVGLAGKQLKGSLALSFSEKAILQIATGMLGEPIDQVDDSIADMVGEITNMVTGITKKILSEKGYKFEMAIPTTIIGKNHSLTHKTSGPVIIIPFTVEAGEFFVEVCFE